MLDKTRRNYFVAHKKSVPFCLQGTARELGILSPEFPNTHTLLFDMVMSQLAFASRIRFGATVLGLLCSSIVAQADEPALRHGAVFENGAAVKGALTATVQRASGQAIDSEALTSFDLAVTSPTANGRWLFYVEGSTTPAADGVSTNLVEANADAGSALDRDDKGRLQVSEVNYRWRWSGNTLTLGLVDATGYLDFSRVANDETTQFLGTGFVNNPTIRFPDYTLGAALHHSYKGQRLPGFTLFVGSSHGLADNPERSYAELIEVNNDEKGIFAGTEVYWQRSITTLRVGAWQNSGEFARLDGSAETTSDHGVYAVADVALGDALLNLRLGCANADVSEAAEFMALAVEYPLGAVPAGLGVARTQAADSLDDAWDDRDQAEFYLRFTPHQNLHISPSLQYIRHSGLQVDATSEDHWVTSLRAGYSF